MLLICLQCTTAYSVGAEGCPQCGSTEYAEEGTEMAKISRHGGATQVGVAGPPPTSATPSVVEVVLELPDGPVDVTEFVLEDDGPDDAPDGPYAGMLRPDLQAACAARGLPTSGNKPELIARLTAADEAAEQDSDPV